MRRIVSPVLASNCYVLFDEDSRRAVVVDPGGHTADSVHSWLTENEASVAAVVLTHGHPDHFWDAAQVAGDAPVIIPGPDRYRLEAPSFAMPPELDFRQLTGYDWQRPATIEDLDPSLLQGEGAEVADGLKMRALPAPGHSEGSTVLFVMASLDHDLASYVTTRPTKADDSPHLVMLAGDVLFAGSMGRTDLPGGDDEEMKSSLRTLKTVVNPETIVLPGHGPATVMAHENATNPFLQFRS
ncbi:MBL fold metallo-hydrolase [Bowdeniella nasicola]|nr:MBL fold metallo-hydrolase [Bowdeniella nasicola]